MMLNYSTCNVYYYYHTLWSETNTTGSSVLPFIFAALGNCKCYYAAPNILLFQTFPGGLFHALMSWPCVRVRVNFSLNIFFSETTTPRELIFGRNVPWVVLFKICSYDSEYFPNRKWKTAKNSLIFKNLLLQNHKCQNWTKAVS
jgi:hypothetical protein